MSVLTHVARCMLKLSNQPAITLHEESFQASKTQEVTGEPVLLGAGPRSAVYPGDTLSFNERISIYQGTIDRNGQKMVQTLAVEDGEVLKLPLIPLEVLRKHYDNGVRIGRGGSSNSNMLRDITDKQSAEWRFVRPGSKYTESESLNLEIDGVLTEVKKTTSSEVLKVTLSNQYSGAARANLLCHETILAKDASPGDEPISERVYFLTDHPVQDHELRSADRLQLVDVLTDKDLIVLQELDVQLNQETKEKIANWAPMADKAVVFLMGSAGNTSPEELQAHTEILKKGFPPEIRMLVMVGNTIMYEEQEDGSLVQKPSMQDLQHQVCEEQAQLHYVGLEITSPGMKTTKIDQNTELVEVGRWGKDVTFHRALYRNGERSNEDVAHFELCLDQPQNYTANAPWLAEGHLGKRVAGELVDQHGYNPPFLIVMGGGSTPEFFINDFRQRGLPIIYHDTEAHRPVDVATTATSRVINKLNSGDLPLRQGLDYIVRTPEQQQAAIREIMGYPNPQESEVDLADFSFPRHTAASGQDTEIETMPLHPALSSGVIVTTPRHGRFMVCGINANNPNLVDAVKQSREGWFEKIAIPPKSIVAAGQQMRIERNDPTSFHAISVREEIRRTIAPWNLTPGSIIVSESGYQEVLTTSPTNNPCHTKVQLMLYDQDRKPLDLRTYVFRENDLEIGFNCLEVHLAERTGHRSKPATEPAMVTIPPKQIDQVNSLVVPSGNGLTVYAVGSADPNRGDKSLEYYQEILAALNENELLYLHAGRSATNQSDKTTPSSIPALLADIAPSSGGSLSIVASPYLEKSEDEAPLKEINVGFVNPSAHHQEDELYLPTAGALKIQQHLQMTELCQKPILLVTGGDLLADQAVRLYQENDGIVIFVGDGAGNRVADFYIRSFEDGIIEPRDGLDYVVRSRQQLTEVLEDIAARGDAAFENDLYKASTNQALLRPGVAMAPLIKDLNEDAALRIASLDLPLSEQALLMQKIEKLTRELGVEVLRMGNYVSLEQDQELQNREPKGTNALENVLDHMQAVKTLLPVEQHGSQVVLKTTDALTSSLKELLAGLPEKKDRMQNVGYPRLSPARIRQLVALSSDSDLEPGDPRIPDVGYTLKTLTPGLVASLVRDGAIIITNQDSGRDTGYVIFLDPQQASLRYPEMYEDMGLRNKASHCFFIAGDALKPLQTALVDAVSRRAAVVTFFVAEENQRSAIFDYLKAGGVPVIAHRFNLKNPLFPNTDIPHYNWEIDLFGSAHDQNVSGERGERFEQAKKIAETIYHRKLPGMLAQDDDPAKMEEELEQRMYSRYSYLSDIMELRPLLASTGIQDWLKEKKIDHLLKRVLPASFYEDFAEYVSQGDKKGAQLVLSTWTPKQNVVRNDVATILTKYPHFESMRSGSS